MAKTRRKGISPSTRFEVFKRDKFACQYCGAKAPDVVLQVDHIHAVANGGDSDVLNLITSCAACNGGKGAKPLSDDSAVERQRDQLAALEDRRQQIEMMVKWRAEISQQDDRLVDAYEEELSRRTGFGFSQSGRALARRDIARHGFAAMFDALAVAVAQYGRADAEGKLSQQSVAQIIARAPRIAAYTKKHGVDPDRGDFAYIQGILRKRCADPYLQCIAELADFRDKGLTVNWMRTLAKNVDSHHEFYGECRHQIEIGCPDVD